MVGYEVTQRVRDERLMPAALRVLHPFHRPDDMRMRPQDHVDVQVGQELRQLLLILVSSHLVLGAPVHGHQDHVGDLPRAGHVVGDAALVDEVDGILGKLILRVAVHPVGIVE